MLVSMTSRMPRWRVVSCSAMCASVHAFADQVKHPFVQQMFDYGVDIEQSFGHTANSRSCNTCSSRQIVRQLDRSHLMSRHDSPAVSPDLAATSSPGVRRSTSARCATTGSCTCAAGCCVAADRGSRPSSCARAGSAPATSWRTAGVPLPPPPRFARQPPPPVAGGTYVVQPGDTLWSHRRRSPRRPGTRSTYVDHLVARQRRHLAAGRPADHAPVSVGHR